MDTLVMWVELLKWPVTVLVSVQMLCQAIAGEWDD